MMPHQWGSTEGHNTCQTHLQTPPYDAKSRMGAVTHRLQLVFPADAALELFMENIILSHIKGNN